ncbi:hypothetical protein [Lacihabitans soyangensis]|jgi:hypothetical protein|uniref:Peptidase M10 n=1 Tax=Lacihabitans soyangensis TaxID=869394 RepID=A0AAE3KRT8_9BACT|nr:hypothetical protein [Lacihabitans soyangensis]MCP9762562.1 peptidase M10 [Lacihabitans soyangensis]
MSAVAIINPETSQISIEAELVFYGKYATEDLAQKIVLEINQMWNEPNAKLQLGSTLFDIVFDIKYTCLGNSEVLSKVLNNTEYAVNFIRIEDKNIAERSMMGFGLGENSGHWLITDQLGESTTAAHEFGHALGLPHPEQLDYRFSGNPPIMAPRGTIVDADFQWNPLAEAGAFGGTMRPIFRRVRSSEVLLVLRGLNPENLGILKIGKLTNQLFDEIGRPVALNKDLTFE